MPHAVHALAACILLLVAVVFDWSPLVFQLACFSRRCLHSLTRQYRHAVVFGAERRVPLKEVAAGADIAALGWPLPVPLIFRGGSAASPALKWIDADIARNPLTAKEQVEVEPLLKEIRGAPGTQISFLTFLARYNESGEYLVSNTPEYLRSDILLPSAISCHSFIDCVEMNLLWWGGNNASSVVHRDDYDNLNCLLRGKKTFIIVDNDKYGHLVDIDVLNGDYSSMDPDDVDTFSFPGILEVPEFRIAELEAGDCIYLPLGWIHQVRSYGHTVAASLWPAHNCLKQHTACSPGSQMSYAQAVTIEYDSDGITGEEVERMREYIRRQTLSLNVLFNVDYFAKSFKAVNSKEEVTDVFNQFDTNRDGLLTESEIVAADTETLEAITGWIGFN